MPVWSHTAPDTPEHFRFRIVRTPPGGKLSGLITSTEMLGCYTHYLQNRTVPCDGDNQCRACHEGFSRRWHAYLGAILLPSMEQVIFEVTAVASDVFKQYFEQNRTLRACQFQASRPNGKPNGRVLIQVKPGDEARFRLPRPPDIQAVLCHIWNVRNGQEKPPEHVDRGLKGIDPANIRPDQKRTSGNGENERSMLEVFKGE